jgi:hypothetical protein
MVVINSYSFSGGMIMPRPDSSKISCTSEGSQMANIGLPNEMYSKSLLGRTVSGEGRGFQLNKTDSFVNLKYGHKIWHEKRGMIN